MRNRIVFYLLCGFILLFGCIQNPEKLIQANSFQTPSSFVPIAESSYFTSDSSTASSIAETPLVPPVQTPYPTPTGKQVVLPAPLYFVSSHRDEAYDLYSQIVRLEKDGKTLTPITPRVAMKINGFDVSPVDGSTVFAAQGSLWITDAENGTVERLIEGLPNPEGTGSNFEISEPAWSPDGAQIAYVDGGIYILDIDSGTSINLIENYNFENVGFGMSPNMYGIWFHSPLWSPDGEAVLFSKQTPTSPTRMLFLLQEDKLDQIPGTLGVVGNNIIWSRDGTALLFDFWWIANVAPIPEIEPSFIRMSRNNFDFQVLLTHRARAEAKKVYYPFETTDGRLLFFQIESCELDCGYSYSLFAGVLTQDSFETRIIRKNALPSGVRNIVWHDSGKSAAFLVCSESDWLIAVMQVDSGEILLLSQENEFQWPIIWGKSY